MDAFIAVLVIAFILGTIFALVKQAKKARETYGFGMVVNWSFALVVLSMIALFFGAIEASKTGSDHASNWFVLKLTSLACLGGAGFLNVKRSTPGFGIWFTFLQVIAAIGIIAPIILIYAHFRSKDALSQSFR